MKIKLTEGEKKIAENFLYARKQLIWNIIYALTYVLVYCSIFLVILSSTTLIWVVFPIIYVCVGSCVILNISCVIAIGILYSFMEIFLNSDSIEE
jgi:hypothetical protein